MITQASHNDQRNTDRGKNATPEHRAGGRATVTLAKRVDNQIAPLKIKPPRQPQREKKNKQN